MKPQQLYLFCIILLFPLALNCNAQQNSNRLLYPGKIWSIRVTEYCGKKSSPETRSHYIKVDSVGSIHVYDAESDWIRNATEYTVYRSDIEDMSEWYEYGTIWEVDSIQKIYYNRHLSRFHYEDLLYDFGAEQGDTLEVLCPQYYWEGIFVRYVVDSIDSISISGVERKRLQLKPVRDDFNPVHHYEETWISGIGSLSGMPYNAGDALCQDSYNLLCVHQGDSLIYQDEYYPSCYVSTVDVQESFAEDVPIEIYPNPTDDILYIDSYQLGNLSVVFTSLNGQLLFSDDLKGSVHQLDLSSFQKGIYFITIRSRDFVTTRKIIKL